MWLGFSYLAQGQESELTDLRIAMPGLHQAANAATALAAVLELRHQGWCISSDAMRRGLAATRLPARVEMLATKPRAVLDVCHNEASARALVNALAEVAAPARRTLIVSVSRDKDVRTIASVLLPHFDRIIATEYQDNPRAVPAAQLASVFRDARASSAPASSSEILIADTPAGAWQLARDSAMADELICVAGSFFLAAEMRPHLLSAARQVEAT
jgi:dihydrofolate synthase/folylpolyglutamate synthase